MRNAAVLFIATQSNFLFVVFIYHLWRRMNTYPPIPVHHVDCILQPYLVKANNVFEIPTDDQPTVGNRRQRHMQRIGLPFNAHDTRFNVLFLKLHRFLRNEDLFHARIQAAAVMCSRKERKVILSI